MTTTERQNYVDITFQGRQVHLRSGPTGQRQKPHKVYMIQRFLHEVLRTHGQLFGECRMIYAERTRMPTEAPLMISALDGIQGTCLPSYREMSREYVEALIRDANKGPAWDRKKPVALFRNTSWRAPNKRFLVAMDCPGLDAAFAMKPNREQVPEHSAAKIIAKHGDIKQPPSKLKRAPWMPIEEQLDCKYQVSLESFDALLWQLHSGSVPIDIRGPGIGWRIWLHALVQDRVHLMASRIAKLPKTIRWLQQHDDQARDIAEAGREFAREHLTYDGILRYTHDALRRVLAGEA